MPETTTAFTACDWTLELDDDTNTLRDISGSSSNCDVNFDHKTGEFRVFGSEWMKRIQCGKDASFKIKGVATTAANEIRDLVEDWFFSGSGLRTFRLSSPGNTVGNKRYVAEVFLKSFKFSGDPSSADPVIYEIELAPDGQVTLEVI